MGTMRWYYSVLLNYMINTFDDHGKNIFDMKIIPENLHQ